MSSRQRSRNRKHVVLSIAVAVGILIAGPALASTLLEGAGVVHSVDQTRQTIVLDGQSFRFDVSTRFYDAQGKRTTSAALKSPTLWKGIKGAMLDPMGIKYQARDGGGMPMLIVVEIMDKPID